MKLSLCDLGGLAGGLRDSAPEPQPDGAVKMQSWQSKQSMKVKGVEDISAVTSLEQPGPVDCARKGQGHNALGYVHGNLCKALLLISVQGNKKVEDTIQKILKAIKNMRAHTNYVFKVSGPKEIPSPQTPKGSLNIQK